MPLDNDDIKQLIAILQKGLSDETDSIAESPKKTKQTFTKTKNYTKSNKKDNKSNNKFDTMMEKNLHKEDLEVDKLLSKYPPTARSREFSPVSVKCRVCGREEEINPALMNDAPNRYKCNRCSKEPG